MVARAGAAARARRASSISRASSSRGDLVVVNTSATMPAAVAAPPRRRHRGRAAPLDAEPPPADGPTAGSSSCAAAASASPAAPGKRSRSPAGGTARAARAVPRRGRLWVARLRPPAARCEPYLAAHGAPIRYGTCRTRGRSPTTRRSSPPSPAAPRCRAPAGRSRPRSITALRRPRRRRRADRAAHRRLLARARRAARTPSATGSRPRRPRASTPPTPPATRDRRRHHRRAGAGDRRRRRRHASTPATAGPTSSITPERGVRAVDGLLTGWHEPEASPPADARGGRRAARCSSAPTPPPLAARLPLARVRRLAPDPAR